MIKNPPIRKTKKEWGKWGLRPKKGEEPKKFSRGWYRRYTYDIGQLEPMSDKKLKKVYPIWHGKELQSAYMNREAYAYQELHKLEVIRMERQKLGL